jgi:hypothetical protein
MRKAKSARGRKVFWVAFSKQLNEALAKTKAAIERFKTDPEGRPEKGDWYDVAIQLFEVTERLYKLHEGKLTK